MQILVVIFLLLVTVSLAGANVNYRAFNLSQKNIATLLGQTIVVPTSDDALPADISFLCADVKYNGDSLKFCELGDAIYMFFTRDMNIEINDHVVQMHAPGWGIFWHYLARCKLPIWFVGKVRDYNACAFDVLERLGGKYFFDLYVLQNSLDFRRAIKNNFVKTNCIKDYSGIVVYCAHDDGQRDSKELLDFKRRYPDLIFVNSAARTVVTYKERTYSLFEHAGLADYIPKTKIVSKNSVHEVQNQNLADEFSSSYLVIKPLAGSCSRGVMVIERDQLAATLTSLFNKKMTTGNAQNPWVKEWRGDLGASVMVSEYVPSKPLLKAEKLYDPTMRVMFMLRYDAGKIFVTVIGAFWKIPVHSLTDEVSLTEKHVTRAHLVVDDPDLFYSGILVEKNDMIHVRKILNKCLPRLYLSMLKRHIF